MKIVTKFYVPYKPVNESDIFPTHAIKTYRESRGIAPLNLNLRTKLMRSVSLKTQGILETVE